MSEKRYHTLTHLAEAADISVKTLRKKVKALLTDPEMARRFGPFPRWTLPLYQQRILVENIPELFHLKADFED